jgi:hypothetical protein
LPGTIKPYKHDQGYLKVDLCSQGARFKFFVHTLVAEAFVLNPEKLLEVNHKDGIRNHNVYSNLEWSTSKANKEHARDVLGAMHGQPPRKVCLSNRDGQVFEFSSIRACARTLGLCAGNIHSVLAGRRQHTGGYTAVYKD